MQLIHQITKQIVDIELVHEFLAAVEDAEHWIEHKVEEILGTDTSIADVAVATTEQAAALPTDDIPVLSTDQVATLSADQAAAVAAPAEEAAEHPAEGL